MKLFNFIGRALSDKGEPSSKRLSGFLILIFTMVIYAMKGSEFDFEFFIAWLGSALVALGISSFDKLMELKKKQQQ